jgi:hypothetical protein
MLLEHTDIAWYVRSFAGASGKYSAFGLGIREPGLPKLSTYRISFQKNDPLTNRVIEVTEFDNCIAYVSDATIGHPRILPSTSPNYAL